MTFQNPGQEPVPVVASEPLPVVAADPIPVIPAPAADPVHVAVVPDGDIAAYKARRPVTLLAAFGLITVTAAAVAALVYDAIVNGSTPSISQLGTLSTLGFGGLLALSGQKVGNSEG